MIRYGQPVYEHDKSIGIRKFCPDSNLNDFFVNYVKDNGNELFFNSENWKDLLFNILNKYELENSLNGRFETEEEYENRIYYELDESKKIIEKELGKNVKFLCWPGGAVTSKALQIASEVGYMFIYSC